MNIKYWYLADIPPEEADVSYTLNNITYYGFSEEPSYQTIEKHDLRRTSIRQSIDTISG